ncbi:MAG: bifunctional oligoribonuclease/PAP phosphatase NrnA [bacterium]
MNQTQKIKEILEILKVKNNFLITSHIDPDGDSIGSQIALFLFLKKMGKKVSIINESSIPDVYKFLPNSNMIALENKKENFEVAIVLDCGDFDRAGKIKEICKKTKYIINIDHHITNNNFGNINYVDGKSSSCGEQIYKIIEMADKSLLDKEISICLYTAIMTDTGSFKYNNTSLLTHKIAIELMKYEIDPYDIYKKAYYDKSLLSLKLLSKALVSLKVDKSGKIAWIVLPYEICKNYSLEDTEGIIEIPRSIKNIEMVIFFKEWQKDKVKITFRSNENIDVSKIAKFFNGGGHFQASGCMIFDTLKNAKKQVFNKIKELGLYNE